MTTINAPISPPVDGRSAWAGRVRELVDHHATSLGDVPTSAQMALVRKAAVLEIALEKLEARFAVTERMTGSELEAYQRGCNTLRRTLLSAGLPGLRDAA